MIKIAKNNGMKNKQNGKRTLDPLINSMYGDIENMGAKVNLERQVQQKKMWMERGYYFVKTPEKDFIKLYLVGKKIKGLQAIVYPRPGQYESLFQRLVEYRLDEYGKAARIQPI